MNIFSLKNSFLYFNILDDFNKNIIFFFLSFIIFFEYPIYLIITCLILIISMVSSIFLTNLKSGYSIKKQYNQVSRNEFLFYTYLY